MTTALKSAGGAFIKSHGGVRADQYAHYHGRDGMGVVDYEGKVYLFGGTVYTSRRAADSTVAGDIWYTENGTDWILRSTIVVDGSGMPSDNVISPRTHPALVVRGPGMVIHSGYGGDGTDAWLCGDGIGRVWAPYVGPGLSGARHYNNISPTLTSINKLTVTGGGGVGYLRGNRYPNAFSNWEYQDTLFTSPAPPQYYAAAELNGNIYLTGGYIISGSTATYYNNTYVSSDGLTFTRISGNYTPCAKHAMLSMDGALYIIAYIAAGASGEYGTNEVWKSTNGTTWTKLTDTPEFPMRYQFSACVFDDKLWIFGGSRPVYDRMKHPAYADVWYSSDGETWAEAVRYAPWGRRAA